ncbi:MAG TPA: RNA polymerase sigma factor [Fodinibius sp.]|nr:RNA polymerase sigma factor [Fodinibius sp.]
MNKLMRSENNTDLDKIASSEAWQELLSGDRGAFELLFRRYYDDLYRYGVTFCGCPDMAEDHIQKLFLKIWRRRETLGEVTGVKTYLWSGLRRSLIDEFRKQQTKKKYLDKLEHDNLGMQLTPEEFIINDELDAICRRALEEAIDQLSSRQQEVVYLKFYEGMGYDEIEQIMAISYQTSRNYVY